MRASPHLVIALLLVLLVVVYYYNPVRMYHSCVQVSDETTASFGSFDCRNFRPDYTLDTTGTLPYVSGADFILYADYIYDEYVRNALASKMRDGDVVYVKTDLIEQFFVRLLPRITTKFILITHNSDYYTDRKHVKYLEDERIIVWIGQNPGFEHPKFVPAPIGFENPTWFREKIGLVRAVRTGELIEWAKRDILLYLNFNAGTNTNARAHLFNSFRNQTGVVINKKKLDYATYLSRLGDSKFVLCPKGNGLDTHRFYEVLLMGAIPVVENSTLWPIFKESTTLVVDDINKLNVEMLREAKQKIKDWSFSRKVLLWETWRSRIEHYRSKYRT